MEEKFKEEKESQLREIEVFEKVARSFLLLTSAIGAGLFFLLRSGDINIPTSIINIMTSFGIEGDKDNIFKLISGFTFYVFLTAMAITYAFYVQLLYRVVSIKSRLKNKMERIVKVGVYILLPLFMEIFLRLLNSLKNLL